MKTHTFHISGMHCPSCVALTEGELGGVPGVTRVRASLGAHRVEVTGDFGDQPPERLAEGFTEILKPHGFTAVSYTHLAGPSNLLRRHHRRHRLYHARQIP